VGKKKYQIFISSTYLDLQDERQAAVEAILGSKHIPAGMELFRAGNASQLDTIKKWIDESDLYMLILGGRYGSIEPKTGKSYTHLEYEYALEKKIPVFAVVLSESFLFTKAAEKSYEVFEKDNKEKYDEFKTYVMTKMIKEVDDCKDIQISIKDSIQDLESEYELCGWIRANNHSNSSEILDYSTEMNNYIFKNGNEKFKIDFTLSGYVGMRYFENVELTWIEIIALLCPKLIIIQVIETLKYNFEQCLAEGYYGDCWDEDLDKYDIKVSESSFNIIIAHLKFAHIIKTSGQGFVLTSFGEEVVKYAIELTSNQDN